MPSTPSYTPSTRATQHVRSRSFSTIYPLTGADAALINVAFQDVRDYNRILIGLTMVKPYAGSAGVTHFKIVASDVVTPLAAAATFATYNVDTTRCIAIGTQVVSCVDARGRTEE